MSDFVSKIKNKIKQVTAKGFSVIRITVNHKGYASLFDSKETNSKFGTVMRKTQFGVPVDVAPWHWAEHEKIPEAYIWAEGEIDYHPFFKVAMI